jgi:hypothetical protein
LGAAITHVSAPVEEEPRAAFKCALPDGHVFLFADETEEIQDDERKTDWLGFLFEPPQEPSLVEGGILPA